MFDGNGNWTSDFSAQADRDNGIKILASRFDNIFIADIKESFENCLTKDGQITPIGNFNMGGQRITNVANGVNSGDAVNVSQLDTTVKLTGDQTIAGTKTYNSSPIVPTPATSDNSTKAASTAFVRNAFTEKMYPNYAGQIVTAGLTTSYTTPSAGWVQVSCDTDNLQNAYFYIDGKEVYHQWTAGDRSATGTFKSGLFFVPAGKTVTATYANNRTAGNFIIFYPVRV